MRTPDTIINQWAYRYEFSNIVKKSKVTFVLLVESYWNQVKWNLDYHVLSSLNFPEEIVEMLNNAYGLPKVLNAENSDEFLAMIQTDFPKAKIIKHKILRNEKLSVCNPDANSRNCRVRKRRTTVKSSI